MACALAVVVAAAPPAAASAGPGGRPEIQEHSCLDAGGTFSRSGPVKTCLTVESVEVRGPEVSAEQFLGGGRTFRVTLVGTSRRDVVSVISTTRQQRGNGPVEESTETVSTATVEPLTCVIRFDTIDFPSGRKIGETSTAVPLSRCSDSGLFVA